MKRRISPHDQRRTSSCRLRTLHRAHPMSAPVSNLRVFVRWDEAAPIYAGEEFACTITLKNIAIPESRPTSRSRTASTANGSTSTADVERLPLRPKTVSAHHGLPSARAASTSEQGQWYQHPTSTVPAHLAHGAPSARDPDVVRKHRSVSIVSLGASQGGGSSVQASNRASTTAPGRTAKHHARSASLQVVSKWTNGGLIPPSTASTCLLRGLLPDDHRASQVHVQRHYLYPPLPVRLLPQEAPAPSANREHISPRGLDLRLGR